MKLGIRTKLNVSILLTVFTVLALLVGFFSINLRKQTINANLKLNDNICSEISSKATASFNLDLGMIEALAHSFRGYAGQSADNLKQTYQQFLEQLIMIDTKHLAVWISLELKEIDPNYTKPYGRVTWLYDRLGGDLKYKSEYRDMDPENLAFQYQEIKESRLESLIDPYYYIPGYEGAVQDSLMEATVGVPVINNGEVVGLAGLDFSLNQLQDLSFNIQGTDTVKSVIISNNGTIVTHPDEAFVGKRLSEARIFGEETESIAEMIESGKEYSVSLDSPEGLKYLTFKPIWVGNSDTPWSVCVSIPYREILNEANQVFWRSLLIGLLGLILITILVFWLSTWIIRPIEETTKQLIRLERGQIDKLGTIRKKSNDEIGAMTYALNSLNKRFKAIVDFTSDIGEGKLDVKYPYTSKEDSLGKALTRMQQNLIKLDNENRDQDWLKSGLHGFSRAIRGEMELEELYTTMVSYPVKYLEAQAGALYIMEPTSKILKLVAGYAISKPKKVNQTLEPGEGLVGQCAQDKEVIVINDVPDNYFAISSGTGSVKPTFITVHPCIHNSDIYGVIEIAGFRQPSKLQIDFLEAVTTSIAIGLNSAFAKEEMKKLLAKTLEQKEELQAQEEELRETNKELEKQAESLRRSEASLQAQQEELRVSNQELEKNAQLLEEQSERIKEKNKELEITRKEIEKKAAQLGSANKYKSEFLANMSHELRTPLNSMLILSQSLAENTHGSLADDEVESANIIYKSGKDLLNLINEVLDLSKIEAGKMDIHPEKFAIADMAKNMKTLFNSACKEKGLDFILEIDDKLEPTMTSDQQRVEQIIKNLISNAVKFTSHGNITMRFFKASPEDASRMDLKDQKLVGIMIKDTGIGISGEKQKLIFEAFQQEDGSTARKYGGTGLGLSISKELAALLGGEIKMNSIQGEGSSFTLILPISLSDPDVQSTDATPDNTEKPKTPAEPSRQPEVKPVLTTVSTGFIKDDFDKIGKDDFVILIIEDDPDFAGILVKQCHKKGFKCLTAGSGEDGLWLAAEKKPSAIILDIKLPGIDGWVVLDQLKKNTETRHIPVHMMSANEVSIEAYQKGAIGYLTKPVSIENLHEAFGRIGKFVEKQMKSLLIVEDDPMMRKAIHKVVSGHDIQVTEVSTGASCLQTIREGVFDCIILDLGLPDMDGFELLKEIKELKQEQIPPIIVYTGQELTRQQDEELQKYTKSIIIKGVKSEERLLDETALFLHRVVGELSTRQQQILRNLYNGDNSFLNKKILIVDDDMRNIFALTKIFEDKGMLVIKAENGKKALEVLQENPDTNLVLMDIMMPEMDGYEATEKIRNLAQYKNLPILALTAKAMKEDKQKCLDAGASDYITKPVDVPKLLSLMRVWLSN